MTISDILKDARQVLKIVWLVHFGAGYGKLFFPA